MPVGLRIINDTSELVFTSDAYTFGYVGTATHSSTVQPDSSIPSGASAYEGYSEYTITWAGDLIMVGIPLGTSLATATGLISATKSGSTWTIRVRRGSGAALNGIGFRPETSTTVYVWGIPHTDPGWGLVIRAPDSSLRADLSRRPLTITERIHFPANDTSEPISTSSPLILTAATGGKFTNTADPGTGDGVIDRYLWWIDGSNLRRALAQRERYSGEDGPSSSASTGAQMALITTSSGL